ncbi:MAG: DMT family transporter [Gammaproteobacteria bacterium]|nr:MAG: DMT family transporter [Gammaproteobacteria bacterium]
MSPCMFVTLHILTDQKVTANHFDRLPRLTLLILPLEVGIFAARRSMRYVVFELLGEISALATALSWSIAVFAFKRLGGRLDAVALTFWKGVLATGALVPVALLWGRLDQLHFDDVLWLSISGTIGITIGDAAFFAALSRLGERDTLIVTETAAPIFTAWLAWLFIQEVLSLYQWLGVVLVMGGVALVLYRPSHNHHQANRAMILAGVAFALLAALCQAGGAVISRDVLLAPHVSSIDASLIRLAVGTLFIAPVWYWRSATIRGQLTGLLPGLTTATFFGTFLAMLLQMASFALAPAAIVQTLFASSIIFTMLIGLWHGQKSDLRAWLGALLALVGVAVIILA